VQGYDFADNDALVFQTFVSTSDGVN
jgi:hypothetical protein